MVELGIYILNYYFERDFLTIKCSIFKGKMATKKNPIVFLEISVDGKPPDRMDIEVGILLLFITRLISLKDV